MLIMTYVPNEDIEMGYWQLGVRMSSIIDPWLDSYYAWPSLGLFTK